MPTLQLNFTTFQSCDGKVVSFQETTGVYNAVTNPGGWGASGEFELSDALSCEIEVTDTGGTLWTIPNPAGFPDDDQSETAVITMANLGGTVDDLFPDGVYLFTYTVVLDAGGGKSTFRTVSRYVFLSAQVKCCIQTMFADLTVNDCLQLNGDVAMNAIITYSFYKAMLYAAVCGQITKANTLMAYVNKLCSGQTNCNTCAS